MRNAKILYGSFGLLAVLGALGWACSTDSPTAPEQNPPPPGGGGTGVAYRVVLTANPSSVPVNSTNPVAISADVHRADNNQRPPSGTTMLLSTNLGSFVQDDPTAQTIAIVLVDGRGGAFLFPGDLQGTATVVGQLGDSFDAAEVLIVEGVVADFSFINTDNNFSIQFLDLSTGDPTSFFWDFGDGTTSTEQHPNHVFPPVFDDYVVQLTASKPGSSDTVAKIVSITEVVAAR